MAVHIATVGNLGVVSESDLLMDRVGVQCPVCNCATPVPHMHRMAIDINHAIPYRMLSMNLFSLGMAINQIKGYKVLQMDPNKAHISRLFQDNHFQCIQHIMPCNTTKCTKMLFSIHNASKHKSCTTGGAFVTPISHAKSAQPG